MKYSLKQLLPRLFFLAMIFIVFSACSETGTNPNSSATPEPSANGSDNGHILSSFTLPYFLDETLNPITGTNKTNLAITPLLYEGLFELDRTFTAKPLLCERYTTTDNLVFTLNLRQGVYFSDGSTMRAADVVYSIEQGKISSLYSARLADIHSVAQNGDLSVTITLASPNSSLPALLDIPIVKNGTASDSYPVGTGPYVYRLFDNDAYLQARSDWWRALPLSLERIDLNDVQGIDLLVQDFDSSEINLVNVDLTGTNALGFSSDCEVSDYPTTIMQYIGFNAEKGAFANAALRRAFSYGIDRDSIVSGLLSRHAVSSVLPVNPSSPLYNNTLANSYGYSLSALSEALSEAGYPDSDGDGVIDSNFGGREAFLSVEMIVNNDNPFKVSMANYIAFAFSGQGIEMNVRELSWQEYLNALSKGDFDLYLGEVRLTADFNLTSLVGSGGSLNYGKYSDLSMDNLLAAFAGANVNRKGAAAAELETYLCTQAPIVPICFKNQSVLTQHGIITGIAPTQQNIFYNMSAWQLSRIP